MIANYMVNDVDDDYNMEDSNRDCIMKGSKIRVDRATDSDERNEVDNKMENESDGGYEHNMECNDDSQTRGKKGKKKQ